MTLTVNGEELSVIFENEKTMGEIFRVLESEFAQNASTIVDVVVNDTVVLPDAFDELFKQDIDAVTSLAVKTLSVSDIKDMFKTLATQCKPLACALQEISVQLQTNNDMPVMKTITDFADIMGFFYKVMPWVHVFEAEFSDIRIADETLIEFAESLKEQLQQFLNAFNQKDTVLLGDIAEYEIAPRLHLFILTFE